MCGCYIRCYVLLVISDAWVHVYINVQHSCTQAGGSRGWERAGYTGKNLHKISVLKLHLFLQNVLQNLV
jgi:hypothetical protein